MKKQYKFYIEVINNMNIMPKRKQMENVKK